MRGRAIAAAICAGLCIGLAAPAHASFPGKNGKIAFVRGDDIWTVNPDGTGRTQITSGPARDSEPHWSPDGTRIAFSSTRDDPNPGTCTSCRYEIYTMDADGTDVQRVTFDATAGSQNTGPAWSPDGTRIAFIRNEGVSSMQVDGTDRQLESPPIPSECNLTGYGFANWSPNGSEIAADKSQICGIGHNIEYTCFLDLAGGEDCWFKQDVETIEAWSPDSQQLLFADDGSVYGLFRRSRTGGGLVQLTPGGATYDGYGGNAAWSPDGQKVVFHRGDSWGDPNGHLFIIDATDGAGLVQLSAGDAGELQPDWQPIPINAYPRPKGATPFLTYLVPAYAQCTTPNREHGPSLSFGSCNPPTQTSDALTIGTADSSNGKPTKSISSVRFDAVVGNPLTPGDQADVAITAQVTDVYTQAGLADYAGQLRATTPLRITDKLNTPHPGGPGAGTVSDIPYGFTIPCAVTADTTIGGSCLLSTSADALAPGAVTEGRRAIWGLGAVEVYDANDDLFMKQGIFVP
jgi:WD40-like Beta Propeller Repeat